jgi:DNA polymerase III subunit delta
VPGTDLKPAYLIAGTDTAKIDSALARLRARAEREGGLGALHVFAPAGGGAPDAEALIGAIPAMSLTGGRRYLLADGVERWSTKQAAPVIEALGNLPPDLTVVLAAREEPPKVRAPRGMVKAVEAAGGEILAYEAPKARSLPGWLVKEAGRRGLALDTDAARLLVDRMGNSTVRLGTELDRLALWAGDGGRVEIEDLEAMIADTSEEATWTLADSLVDRDGPAAMRAAERLAGQGEPLTPLVYQAAKRLRAAHQAVGDLERGRPAKEVESALDMHPYAAKLLVKRVRSSNAGDLRAATCAMADLEWGTRGGSDYPEEVAVTLAVRRAVGQGA